MSSDTVYRFGLEVRTSKANMVVGSCKWCVRSLLLVAFSSYAHSNLMKLNLMGYVI